MKDMKSLLKEERNRIKNIKVPDSLEAGLKEALDKEKKRKPKGLKLKIASLILVVFLLGYNMDSLAQYGKKLMGYETLMKGTIRELNDLGKGQVIDKSYEFKSGEKITLDLVMLDDNNMILFYTIYDPKGNVEGFYDKLAVNLEKRLPGMFGSGGAGKTSQDGKEMKWVLTVEGSPKFYERNLKLVATLYKDNNTVEIGKIPFKLNMKEAVGKTLVIDIDKKIKLDKRTIKLKSLSASPTSTRIEGQIQNIVELGLDHINETRIMVEEIDLTFLVNGVERSMESASVTTDMKGMYFKYDFDALPKDIEEIQIKLKGLSAVEEVKERISLEKGKEVDLEILGENIKIKKVYEKDGATYIDIASQDTTSLNQVFLEVDGRQVPLASTAGKDKEKVLEGDLVTIINNRTLKFEDKGEELNLLIDRISFTKSYDKVIYQYKFK